MSRRQGLRASNGRMAGRQSLRRPWRTEARHSIQLPGRCLARGRAVSVRRVRARSSFHHPLAALALQHILHRHSGRRRVISLGLKVYLRGGFVFTKSHGTDAHIHRHQIRTLRQVGHDALSNGLLVLDIFLTARQQNDAHGGGHDESRTNHISDYSRRGMRAPTRVTALNRKILGSA
jgi:hypothetical protein